MRDFRNLDVWTKAHSFTLHIYKATEGFPRTEIFGLAATLRRRSADIPMKIAEACGKDIDLDFTQQLRQARGIGLEVEYQLLLSRDLQLIETPVYEMLRADLIEVRRMLSGLIKAKPI